MKWTSGRRSSAFSVCPGDLIAFRLKVDPDVPPAVAGEGPYLGYPPHIVFVPEFGNGPQLVGGSQISSSDPVEFKLNMAPFWVPYRGQIYLDGGLGVAYLVTWTQSRCHPRPADDLSITLEDVDTVTAVQLPRNVYAVQAAFDCDLIFAHAGDTRTISLAAGQKVPLGQVAQGTVKSASGIVPIVTLWVRY